MNYLRDLFAYPQRRTHLRQYFWLTVGAFVLAFNFAVFIAPSRVAHGGLAGLTLVLNDAFNWPNAILLTLLSIPILILGYRFLGRFGFVSRTLYVTLLHNIFVALLSRYVHGITKDLLLNAIFGGLLNGVGLGLCLRGSGTLAGTGIISSVIRRRTGIPMSQLHVLIDGLIIIGMSFTFGWDRALYGLIMLFIRGLAIDYVLEGPSIVRMVFVITDNPEDVSHALLHRLHVGVTAWRVEGMFTHKAHMALFCTIRRSDVDVLRQVVHAIDQKAFIVVGKGHRASGGVWQYNELKIF